MAATTPSQLDQALADAATQIQSILSALQGGASTGSLNATDIQQLQTAAVALSADIMQAGPAVAALEQQLLACQQQPQPAPQPSPAPAANAALMVDAKVAALVALGALVLGGAGGYLLKGSGILGGEGKSRKRHNPLAVTEAARRRRLPTHSKPKQLPRKS